MKGEGQSPALLDSKSAAPTSTPAGRSFQVMLAEALSRQEATREAGSAKPFMPQPAEQLTEKQAEVTSPHPPNPITLPQGVPAVQELPAKLVGVPTHGFAASDIVTYLVAHPDTAPKALAAHYGKTFKWLAAVISTSAFQEAIGPVKHLIVDPFYSASMAERFQALTLQSLDVLSAQLEKADVSEFTVTKAAEIGFKALGMGQQLQHQQPQIAVVEVGANAVADRIMAAMAAAKERANKPATLENNVTDVTAKATAKATAKITPKSPAP